MVISYKNFKFELFCFENVTQQRYFIKDYSVSRTRLYSNGKKKIIFDAKKSNVNSLKEYKNKYNDNFHKVHHSDKDVLFDKIKIEKVTEKSKFERSHNVNADKRIFNGKEKFSNKKEKLNKTSAFL